MAMFDHTTPEEWYAIPGFPGYEISSRFRVRSFRKQGGGGGVKRTPRLLFINETPSGYLFVTMMRESRPCSVRIHRIVAELVYGPLPSGLLVLHRDDNKKNNHPSNLYFGTDSQNKLDSFRNGVAPIGSQRAGAKLTESDIPSIREMIDEGLGNCQIARIFGVSPSTIKDIKVGRNWGHA